MPTNRISRKIYAKNQLVSRQNSMLGTVAQWGNVPLICSPLHAKGLAPVVRSFSCEITNCTLEMAACKTQGSQLLLFITSYIKVQHCTVTKMLIQSVLNRLGACKQNCKVRINHYSSYHDLSIRSRSAPYWRS